MEIRSTSFEKTLTAPNYRNGISNFFKKIFSSFFLLKFFKNHKSLKISWKNSKKRHKNVTSREMKENERSHLNAKFATSSW